jgi:hypothetical protein
MEQLRVLFGTHGNSVDILLGSLGSQVTEFRHAVSDDGGKLPIIPQWLNGYSLYIATHLNLSQ